jgi:Domain of unknown function (DUF4411)
MPKFVYEELLRIDDHCAPWAKGIAGFVVEATDDEFDIVATITADHPDWVQEQKNAADPWIVARATVLGGVILTHERMRCPGVTEANLAIPNVAASTASALPTWRERRGGRSRSCPGMQGRPLTFARLTAGHRALPLVRQPSSHPGPRRGVRPRSCSTQHPASRAIHRLPPWAAPRADGSCLVTATAALGDRTRQLRSRLARARAHDEGQRSVRGAGTSGA